MFTLCALKRRRRWRQYHRGAEFSGCNGNQKQCNLVVAGAIAAAAAAGAWVRRVCENAVFDGGVYGPLDAHP